MLKLTRNDSARLLTAVGLLFAAGVSLADAGPGDWLNRMAAAVQSTSYEGTVIRLRNGKAEALKVVHTVDDGVIREKVVAQEGSGLEIIRRGNEVHCILPERKSVLIEEWDNQSTLFSTLPRSRIQFGNEYDLAIVRKERVAGRQALLLAIRPHDGLRYGHRIWLDTETGFPLQTQLIDEHGEAIEQVTFADIEINREIHASQLAPSYSTDGFTWLRQSSGHSKTPIVTEWSGGDLPTGFRAVSAHEEAMQDGGPITHIVFSDGLATVSVFISPTSGNFSEGASEVGGSHAYGLIVDGYEITAMGEVPPATVRQIATGMQRP